MTLADRSLRDTLAVVAAARGHSSARLATELGDAGQLAMLAHLIDYDDLHVPSTSHISAVCLSAALAIGGGARAYLAGAGVMARLGVLLGWGHFEAGWHATCTAGAPGAAVVASIALGLDRDGMCNAINLAVPAAGGVKAAFGSDGKALQVGFATDAGVRAARLALMGATAGASTLGQWLELVAGRPGRMQSSPAIPGGLAVKVYPCCYALQRPIEAVREALRDTSAKNIESVRIIVPEAVLRPLIHPRPRTGLEGKFSIEYAVAATILDGRPGLPSFTDAAVLRPEAQRLLGSVQVEPTRGGEGLLTGSVTVEIRRRGGAVSGAEVMTPLGASARPLGPEAMRSKVEDCAGERDAAAILGVTWTEAPALAARLTSQAVVG